MEIFREKEEVWHCRGLLEKKFGIVQKKSENCHGPFSEFAMENKKEEFAIRDVLQVKIAMAKLPSSHEKTKKLP